MALDILIVDDEPDIRILTSGILEDEGFQTRNAESSRTALRAIETRRPGLILLDIWLQGSELDGLEILEVVKRDYPGIPVVMMSGHGTIETAVKAINIGAYDFIEKPFKADRLLLCVERAVEASRLRRENEELRLRAGTEDALVGESQVMVHLRQAIEKVAQANSRVLIAGPAGSGKEVTARMIHRLSARAEEPFVVVNCAAMEPNHMEIKLFGTEEAPREGETGIHIGTFEQAHNGTLFLDGISDMPIETQGKIVRVLQEQVFERVGGNSRVEVDVRVIASASQDLQKLIAGNLFREDLFYRLSVVPITVPSLNERRNDIPLLADFFMTRAAAANGQPPRRLGADAIVTLQAYEWPGNVRELRNVIERLLIMAPGGAGDEIGAAMLPAEIVSTAPSAEGLGRSSDVIGLPLREAREIFEREYLHSQVARFGGNISRTAAFIGMERSALHRKLKSLGIHSDRKPGRR
jgi:two-component system nitrogen regulation response regulator NtrX